jgi:hypothetical protein
MTTFSNVNIGTDPNDGTGDPLRTGFNKINQNFQKINTIWPDVSSPYLTVQGLTSSVQSIFKLLQADEVQSQNFGNTGSNYQGNTYSASASFQGNLGALGGNAAIVSTLSATGNVAVGNLIVNGSALISNFTISSLNNVIIGNTTPAAGSFTRLIASNATINGNASITGILSNTSFTVSNVGNFLGSNLAAASNIGFAPTVGGTSQIIAVSVNTNVTLSYTGTITPGADRRWVFKNRTDGVVRSVVLPNTFNNKNSNVAILAANSSMMMHFIPFDSTSANVYVNITNT